MAPRDKESTKKKILQAVTELLLENGDELGINRIAERAGVDKVLIYRYFGGLAGLLSTYAQDTNIWPEFEEIMESAPYVAALLPPDEISARFVRGLLRELQSRPDTLEILRTELHHANDLTHELAAVREQRLAELLECHAEKNGDDVAASYALITAGLIYLMLHAKTAGSFCSVSLQTAEGWERLERAAAKLLS